VFYLVDMFFMILGEKLGPRNLQSYRGRKSTGSCAPVDLLIKEIVTIFECTSGVLTYEGYPEQACYIGSSMVKLLPFPSSVSR
jgi:hypothetical protein